jgi:pectate lyase
LGDEGKEFTQWAFEELTAWGKVAYRKKDNSFIPMLTDGTSMEGYVCKKDGYFGPKGRVLTAGRAGPMDFWTYALAYRVTGDEFMWEMARNIARGNNFGDIGATPKDAPQLQMSTDCTDPVAVLGLLELHKKTAHLAYLSLAKKVADNILKNCFHKGFFVRSRKHLYAKFDALGPLVLLRLHCALKGKPASVPRVWPSTSFFHCPHDGKGRTYDNSVIYSQRIP